jgi:hypothetical protein
MAPSRKAGARGSQRSEKTLPPLAVRYMRRMKRQKVYTYEVSWKGTGNYRGPASPVVVRLIAAGAQVVPSERTLDPAKPNVKALFYVTPLARGWLRGERLEVVQDGQKVQEIHLPGKVVSQRLAGFLLALTFLLPWFLSTVTEEASHHKELLGTRIMKYLDENAPPTPAVLYENVPQVHETVNTVVGFVVKDVVNTVQGKLNKDPRLIPWITVGLFFLALVSWFLHRDKRKRRTGKPIPVPETDEAEADDDDEAAVPRRRSQAAEVEVG